MFSKTFPYLVKFENETENNKPLRFYIEELREETLAWEKGLKLTKKLGILLNENKYWQYASKFLLRYMALATIDKKWLLR